MSTGATGEFVIRFMARMAEINGSHVIRQCPAMQWPGAGGPVHVASFWRVGGIVLDERADEKTANRYPICH